jgi:hypothetical protein
MSYQANKPFGRRKTDKSLPPAEHQKLQNIRHEVEEDKSGLLRRYMRLAEKVLGPEQDPRSTDESSAEKRPNSTAGRRAA